MTNRILISERPATDARSYLTPDANFEPYNPDDVFQKRGDYSLYEEMTKDDQVSVALQLKKDIVLSTGWILKSQTENDQDVVDDLQYLLSEMCDLPFTDQLEGLLTAYEFGVAFVEKVFGVLPDGRVYLKCLKARHPSPWLVHTNDFGDVVKFEQRGTKRGDLVVPPEALIHYKSQPRFDNPYGTSDLRAAYPAWFAKRQVLKYFLIFLEKSASPIPVARYASGVPQSDVDAVFTALKRFQAATAMTVPEEFKIEFLEVGSNGEAYRAAIAMLNMFIGRALLIPDLMGFQGNETGGGSYSLGREQIQIFFRHMGRRRSDIENIVNAHIVAPLALVNHGVKEYAPKFAFKPIDAAETAEFLRIWLEAMKSPYYKPSGEELNHFRKLINFPESDEETAPEVIPPNPMPNKFAARQPTRYEGRTDFAFLGDLLDKGVANLSHSASVAFNALLDQLAESIKKNHEDYEAILREFTWAMDSRHDPAKVISDSLTGGYRTAWSAAAGDLKRKADFAEAITDAQFLKLLESETYDYVGDWRYNISKQARVRIVAAIKDGLPIADVVDSSIIIGLKDYTQASVDRYARTKFTEVMNKGRLDYFKNSNVVAAYQYSAIMDDRVTDICSGLDGKVFKAGTEPVPPLHFSCRSTLVPITVYEDYDVDDNVDGQDIQAFIEENKGEGFATK